MGNPAAAPAVRCLTCGTRPHEQSDAPFSLRSQSERFAFADCPRCNCVRMMALERPARAHRERPLAAAGAPS